MLKVLLIADWLLIFLIVIWSISNPNQKGQQSYTDIEKDLCETWKDWFSLHCFTYIFNSSNSILENFSFVIASQKEFLGICAQNWLKKWSQFWGDEENFL